MLNGNILDVYPDPTKNVMISWIITDGKAIRIEDAFEPSFFVYAPKNNLYNVAEILQDLPQVKQVHITQKKIVLGSQKHHHVLEVTPRRLGDLTAVATMIDLWGGFHTYHLFNVDIRLPTRYLHTKGVFCNASVGWDGKQFHDDQWALDYDRPSFTSIYLAIHHNSSGTIAAYNDPIAHISINDTTIAEENETDTILAAVKEIQRVDPDFIYTQQGDSVLFPYLAYRAHQLGIYTQVTLGRESHTKTAYLRPTKQSKSYFSYGQIIYRPAFYTLQGRIHIDTTHSFLYGESGLHGLLDISRCSNIPMQLLSRLGPGTAISQIQVNEATNQGYLIPWKKNMPEGWKTGRELLAADRGGLILEPAVGLHEGIVELDFASLYPNIMLRYNISPETLLCSCCPSSHLRVPQLGYHICVNHRGLLPTVLEPILRRRFCFKARSKNNYYDREYYKELQGAWKWVLLVCFGYTGYRNARYGRIECHESITAFSRDILLTAMEVAEAAGYSVLHGIIDSLWIKRNQPEVTPTQLARLISKRTGIKMDVEGRYKWIVFLPSKNGDVGALNRYYGLFDTNELKIRGVELRQHNTPVFLQTVQQAMLDVLSLAHTAAEFRDLIPAAVATLVDYGKKITQGSITLNHLAYTTRVSRAITDYKVNTLVKAALLQLRDIHITIEPGQSVRYIVTDEHAQTYTQRVCVAEQIRGDEPVDVDFYLRQIAKCGESILIPFGYTMEKLETLLQKLKYRENHHVSILSGM
jgi:DNA polymerase-2